MTIPGGYVAGDILTAANLNFLPAGRKGGGHVIAFNANADQTGITTVVDVTSATLSFTAVAGRLYRVSVLCGLLQAASTGTATLYINRGGSDLATLWQGSVTTTVTQSVVGFFLEAPGGGAVTYKVRAATSAGTLSIKNTQIIGMYIVEDVGPST